MEESFCFWILRFEIWNIQFEIPLDRPQIHPAPVNFKSEISDFKSSEFEIFNLRFLILTSAANMEAVDVRTMRG
jgi:hypothetical protein